MGWYINKIEILILLDLSVKLTESTGQDITTAEMLEHSTANYTDDEYGYDEDEMSDFALNIDKIVIWFWKVLAPTFLVVGVVGNTLSILVWRS